MRTKLGRPMKEVKNIYIPLSINLLEKNFNELMYLVEETESTKSHIVRLSIDYLYHLIKEGNVPVDILEELAIISSRKDSSIKEFVMDKGKAKRIYNYKTAKKYYDSL